MGIDCLQAQNVIWKLSKKEKIANAIPHEIQSRHDETTPMYGDA
jgi:hypothetical protein